MTRIAGRRSGQVFGCAAALAALVLTACSAPAADGPKAALAEIAAAQQPAAAVAAAPAPAAAAAAPASCTPGPAASYPPLSSLTGSAGFPSGSLQAVIRARSKLVVGVSGDTRLLGARDSLQGGALEGFDIEMARVVARAIFGVSGDVDAKIQWKVITASDRFPLVNKGVTNLADPASGVDLVARAFSTTCDRWANQDVTKGSDFSASYLTSEQRILVRRDLVTDKKVNTITDLARVKPNAKVCAPSSSTSLAVLAKVPGVVAIAVPIHSDCMALWQEGQVDAITGDDAILAGFADQDPRARVVGPRMDVTNYALAVGRKHTSFVQFVNAALASPEGKQAWVDAYTKYLAPSLGAKTMPVPDYGRSPA